MQAYDAGYRQCPCFWGIEPGSLVVRLASQMQTFEGKTVLDAGCGEGKNAAYLANRGAVVDAIDSSNLALENGKRRWGAIAGVNWLHGDVRSCELPRKEYDVVVCYGVLHCLESPEEAQSLLERLMASTARGGSLVVCAFNARDQDLSGHPGFLPLLLEHEWYCSRFVRWQIDVATDADLYETHPHNAIAHHHSLTRILARKL